MATSIDSAERIGLMAAMQEELDAVLQDFSGEPTIEEVYGRFFYRGDLHGRYVTAAVGDIGKTDAATTATLLLERYGNEGIIMTGTSGAVAAELRLGDIVIASAALHHDVDASPRYLPNVVPSIGLAEIPTSCDWSDRLFLAAMQFAVEVRHNIPKVRRGLILTGDAFMDPAAIEGLRQRFPNGLAADMESAAVTQVCARAGAAVAIVRSISDGGSTSDFEQFLAAESGPYAAGIIGRTLLQR